MIRVSNCSRSLKIKLSLLIILFLDCGISYTQENKSQVMHPSSSQQNIPNVVPVMIDLKLPADAILKTDPNNQTIIFLKAENLSLYLEKDNRFEKLLLAEKFGEAAINFLEAYRSLFKLVNPEKELVIKSIEKDDIGYKHIRLNQVFSNITIWGSELIVHFDKDNHVYLVNGRYTPTPSELNTQPVLNDQEIKAIVTREFPQLKSECNDCRINLVIFNDSTNKPHLAYQVFVSVSLAEGWEIIVDAETGGILQKTPTVYH